MENCLENREKINSLSKEKLWKDVFGNDYNPDFDYSKFFRKAKSVLKSDECGLSKSDTEKFLYIIEIVKKNNYLINIDFLESLDIEEKFLISRLFIDYIGIKKDKNKVEMGKSLLIYMYYYYSYSGKYGKFTDYFNVIGQCFTGVNFLYFRQAYFFLKDKLDSGDFSCSIENFLFDVIVEYNLIKNLDKDISSINEENKLDLEKDFSLGTFHAKCKKGYGAEMKYGDYGLDKDGNETNIHKKGMIDMIDDSGFKRKGAFTLDRDNDLIYKDASGIMYEEYLDSPSGVVLLYKNNPIACICFYIKNGNEIFINQIQKVVKCDYDRYGRCVGRHYSKVSNDIDWKNILYKAIKLLIEKYHIYYIVIQGAKNNRWVGKSWTDYETPYFKEKISGIDIPKNIEKARLTNRIAYKIYDIFAQSLGFTEDEFGNWKMKI